ncbi:hypothetical protein C8Q79DRAFT_1012450 [Trametes meyenii]|nr:hypothetical protein C8Q79DRAFT_1012450 [Trametes meyenii]
MDRALKDITSLKAPKSSSHESQVMARMHSAAASFVKTGVELEQELLHLCYLRTQAQSGADVEDDGFTRKISLPAFLTKLAKWQRSQHKHMHACEDVLPTLADDTAEAGSEEDENDVIESLTLGLPSEFCGEDRAEYDLEAVRMAVKFRAAHIEHKKKNVRSTKANINAKREIKHAEQRARLLASRYNSNFTRISMLRPAGSKHAKTKSAESRLRVIDVDKDLAITNMAIPRSLGDSHLKHSWIWGVFDQSGRSKMRTKGVCLGLNVDTVQWF